MANHYITLMRIAPRNYYMLFRKQSKLEKCTKRNFFFLYYE